MKSAEPGTNTSDVEVVNVSPQGLWLLVKGREYFLSRRDFPWFQNARLTDIRHVELLHGRHLHWAELDVDLDLDALGHLDRYPLKYR